MATLVYVVGSEGEWSNDSELLYSLRSLSKYAKNVDRVVIITNQKLNWINHEKVEVIPFEEKHKLGYRNVWDKIDYACDIISTPFVLMNDDFLLNKKIDMDKLPLYLGKNPLKSLSSCRDKRYAKLILNTIDLLEHSGIVPYNYALHAPMVIDPYYWKIIMAMFNKDVAISIRSAYGSVFHAGNGVLTDDYKINKIINRGTEIEDIAKVATWISLSDAFMVSTHGKVFLQVNYSKKSKYELC